MIVYLIGIEREVERSFENKMDPGMERKKVIKNVLRYYLRHGISFVALIDLFKTLNSLPDTKYTYPTTECEIMKFLSTETKTTYHIQCSQCLEYVKSKDTRIEVECQCGGRTKSTKKNFFISFNVESQLKKSVTEQWKSIKEYCVDINAQLLSSSDIKDVFSGRILKQLYSTSTKFMLPLCVNTDGAKVFKTGAESLWPVLLIQNYLPPNLRYLQRNIIIAGLYYGDKKPDMRKLFEPIVAEFETFELNDMEWIIEGTSRIFEPIITMCTLDLPAKAAVQQIKQYNGFYACTYCLHPGIAKEKEKGKGIRYGCVDPPPARRTNMGTLIAMNSIMTSDVKISANKGVIGVSCLVALSGFDIIEGFGIDYMHCVLLGVTRKLLNYWLASSNWEKDFYIGPKPRDILNRRILSIQPPSNIKRLPRSIDYFNTYKANELRSLLLYHLPVCLPGLHKYRKYYQHFMKLSTSIYILLKTTISPEELEAARINLNDFVVEFETHYGSENVVMNVHLINHIVDSVRNHGPLWTHSAFAFESCNGVICKYISGRTDVLLQIASKYLMHKTLFSRNISFANEENTSLLGNAKKIKIDAEDIIILKREQIIEENTTHLFVYLRYMHGNTIYSSDLYVKGKRHIDYFVGLNNGSFGIVKYYFQSKHRMYAMIQSFEQVDRRGHIQGVQENFKMIIPATYISNKYIYMKILSQHWIVAEPNPFEQS